MAVERSRRFSFDLSELEPEAEPPALRVVATAPAELPRGAAPVPPPARPRWLGRLLPALRARDTLRLEVRGEAAPGFADHLLACLAAVFSAAGSDAGVDVIRWQDGLAVGTGGPGWVPETPAEVLVPCDLSGGAVRAATVLAGGLAGARVRLVLNGDLPQLDEVLDLRPGLSLVSRLPLLSAEDLAPLVRGCQPALAGPAYGRPLAALAREILRCHLAAGY